MNTPIYDELKSKESKPWVPYTLTIIPNPKPESRWKTFLRCLLWWLP